MMSKNESIYKILPLFLVLDRGNGTSIAHFSSLYYHSAWKHTVWFLPYRLFHHPNWRKQMKKIIAIMLALLLVATSLFAQSISEAKTDEQGRFSLGMKTNGFTVMNISDFDMIGSEIVELRHDKTGATVLLVLNEDTNRTFDITFRTPTEQDTGIPHVFEHSTLDGSEKFPSKALWFNLVYQTYNTFMNAFTYPFMTTYPVASLSEDQLFTLSDFYTDSVFNPMLLEDKSIFDEEAWRYVLNDPDDDLTIAGTVYSEMLGATTRTRKAEKNFQSIAFPGSFIANDSGGNPDVIPEMTWDDIKDYHDKYYHPSNSLTILYGKIDRWSDFLGMLDSYFSDYQAKTFDIVDTNYTPITGAVEKTFEFPVESGSDTTNASTIYYGFICKDIDQETMNQIDLMTTLAGNSSSILMENLKNALPYGSFSCYIDFGGPELVIEFIADNVNAEDADLFKSVVDSSMAQIASEGFDPVAVDSIISSFRLSLLLSGESSSVGTDVMPNIAYYWAGTDLLYGYRDFIDSVENFQKWNDEGVFKDITRKYIVNNNLNALATTTAVAGLKEQKDAELADRLAKVKASMTKEQIAEIVKTTNEAEEENVDTAAMVRQIQVVDVDSLPEETRIYDIQDQTGADGIRRLWAEADVSDVGYAGLLLDASGLKQDQIHYFKLFSDMLTELDTEKHTRTELASLTTRYLYNGTIRISLIEDEITKEMTPRLRVGFIAMDEDMPEALDLVHELLFENVFDVKRVTDLVSNMRNTLKQSLNNASYQLLIYRSFARQSELNAYYNYANYLDYYFFLDNLLTQLETDPDTVIANLKAIADYLDNSTNAIILFAGSKESYDKYLPVAEAFMSGLGKKPIEKQTYDFPIPADSEAIIIDSSVNFNVIFATNEELGYDKSSGDLDAVSSLINDMYLLPELRDERGAYGAYIYFSDYGAYAFTYRDPNIADSYEVFDGLADFVSGIDIDQETLDGYILSSYSSYALGSGELSGASTALLNEIGHEDQNRTLEYMRQLKSIKADSFAKTYAPLFQDIVDNYTYSTSGSASAISQVESAFEVVMNPFGVEDRSQAELIDVTGDGPFDEAILFCFVNGLMAANSTSEFGVNLPATLGEFAQVLVALLGADYPPEDSIALLANYGVVPMADVDTQLSIGELDSISCRLLAAFAGMQVDELMLSDISAMGIDPASDATRDIMAQYVFYLAN